MMLDGNFAIAYSGGGGLIEPDLVTAGGHFRFDPEHVRRQLRALQQRGDS